MRAAVLTLVVAALTVPVSAYAQTPAAKTLADSRNNIGVAYDALAGADLDGAGDAFSGVALQQAGVTPGATVTSDDMDFVWPDTASGEADNVQASGQTIAISGALGAGIVNSIVSLTVVFVPQITRVAESVTTGVRNMDFVEAARASGAGPLTVMRVHMLGNVLGPIFVYATGLISVSMILAAGLSFLGLGTKPPEPEWGLMLNTLRTAIYVNPWVAALPGVMIFTVSICFNLLSDGMRSAMDVRS